MCASRLLDLRLLRGPLAADLREGVRGTRGCAPDTGRPTAQPTLAARRREPPEHDASRTASGHGVRSGRRHRSHLAHRRMGRDKTHPPPEGPARLGRGPRGPELGTGRCPRPVLEHRGIRARLPGAGGGTQHEDPHAHARDDRRRAMPWPSSWTRWNRPCSTTGTSAMARCSTRSTHVRGVAGVERAPRRRHVLRHATRRQGTGVHPGPRRGQQGSQPLPDPRDAGPLLPAPRTGGQGTGGVRQGAQSALRRVLTSQRALAVLFTTKLEPAALDTLREWVGESRITTPRFDGDRVVGASGGLMRPRRNRRSSAGGGRPGGRVRCHHLTRCRRDGAGRPVGRSGGGPRCRAGRR